MNDLARRYHMFTDFTLRELLLLPPGTVLFAQHCTHNKG